MALTVDEPIELESELGGPGGGGGDGHAGAGDRAGPRITLRDDVADAYIDLLRRALAGARLNALFPPEPNLSAHLSFLSPSGCEHLYSELPLSPESGLPSARAVLRVKIDRDLAQPFLADMARRAAPAEGSRLWRRRAYYTRLTATEIMPLGRMRVELRQHIPELNLAQFRVLYDRFDLGTAQFTRYTILLGQRDRFWQKRHVIVDDADLAAPTESFRRIVRRFTADEAELAFVLLSRVPGIEVEDVRRARVGPMYLPGVKVGDAIERLLDRERTPEYGAAPRFILCLPEDRAGIDIGWNASGDPLAPLFREALSEDTRALLDAKADELDYRVAKTRKFVCSAALGAPLTELCRALGAPSIIRTIAD